MTSSGSQPTEGPFIGCVETTMNALRLIQAARQGVVYREIGDRPNSRGSHQLQTKAHGSFKPGGLIKKTITVTIEESHFHLIAYHTPADQRSGKFKKLATRFDIMSLPMDPRLFRSSSFRVPLEVETALDGTSHLIECDELSDVLQCTVESNERSMTEHPAAHLARHCAIHRNSSPSCARRQGETCLPSSPPTSSVYADRSGTGTSNPYPIPLEISSRQQESDAWYSHSDEFQETDSFLPYQLQEAHLISSRYTSLNVGAGSSVDHLQSSLGMPPVYDIPFSVRSSNSVESGPEADKYGHSLTRVQHS
ncbi:hypothetical protein B0H16DRAFT_1712831 [Mycena metata]|uniref:Uncharacterized protein n=1 Tax=Mycena metata TaxID=1033252 RepID=A0AAD7K667_9AGAR|nr:hypothetical protein B0H16DRAFT_1712831 [Mycena metata]